MGNFQVSTDYDQKEEIFRNHLLVIGPYSQPGLAVTTNPGDKIVTSVVWIDPADIVAGSFEVS